MMMEVKSHACFGQCGVHEFKNGYVITEQLFIIYSDFAMRLVVWMAFFGWGGGGDT